MAPSRRSATCPPSAALVELAEAAAKLLVATSAPRFVEEAVIALAMELAAEPVAEAADAAEVAAEVAL